MNAQRVLCLLAILALLALAGVADAQLANIGRGMGDNDTISLIDLRAKPPRVVETIGQTPEGITFSPDGSPSWS